MEPNPYQSPKSAPAVQKRFAGLWKRALLAITTIGCSIVGGSLTGGTFAVLGCGIWWLMHDYQLLPREEWFDSAFVGLGFGAELGWIFGLVAAWMWYVRSPFRSPAESSASDK